MRKFASISLLALILSACGFHLRGNINIPPWLNNIAIIDNANNSGFRQRLTSQLEAYDINITPSAEQASYWIVIQYAGYQKQITSVGSGSNPRQYLLIYSVDFMLEDGKGKLILPLTHVSSTRQLTINNNRILGSDEEASLLIKEMQQDAALQLLNRINHAH